MAHLKPKYVAEGFDVDSGSLLNEFADMNSVEFRDFASLWRKHYFSLIFMGRPDHTETGEFVNETFRVTSQYLLASSFYQQVGAVYILYGLFRNQISNPPVKIRLELSHWKVIKALRDEAIMKKYLTLHYVIDYLIDHAFLFVASQTLKGPLIGQMPKTTKKGEPICNLKATYKSDILKYSVSNNLADLRDLQIQYLAEKKKIGGSSRLNLCEGREIYDVAINELLTLVNPKSKMKKRLVGERRAKIKAESFIRKSKNRFGETSDDELVIDEGVDDPTFNEADVKTKKQVKTNLLKPKRTRKPRRPPKEQRRVGRPRLKPKKEPEPEPKSDEENNDLDITHLLPQQKNFYLPPVNSENKKNRTKRDPYYQLSPKPEDSNSNSDTEGA